MLSVTDMPAGWSASTVPETSSKVTDASCLSSLGKPRGLTSASEAFVQGTSIPSVAEVLAVGSHVHATWKRLGQALGGCHTLMIPIGKARVRSSIRPLAFPRIGSSSSAYAWSFTISGLRISFDLVLFNVGRYAGYLVYADLVPPPAATIRAFVAAAVAKARSGSAARISDALSIASAPVKTANTAVGHVAYRVLGSGPPLVLIMGYGASMEEWDRRFVDALAQRYRVVIFDNAGIGRSRAVKAPLTIDAMAEQTSALIRALGLRLPDVLGWSMGSMVAQALAVQHPDQVRRLILCATYPGNGTAAQPSKLAINALDSGNPKRVEADLFPSDQTAAATEFSVALSAYPAAAPVPAKVVSAQANAINAWWRGADRAGRHASTITAPTLVADGTLDRLDPTANSYAIARLIHGATLKLYAEAGHAFLFQDQGAFVPVIESFLG
jgi:pimeloyl-ACP methyl ester carboxylesterase